MASAIDGPTTPNDHGLVGASDVIAQANRHWNVSGTAVLAAWGVAVFASVRAGAFRAVICSQLNCLTAHNRHAVLVDPLEYELVVFRDDLRVSNQVLQSPGRKEQAQRGRLCADDPRGEFGRARSHLIGLSVILAFCPGSNPPLSTTGSS